MECFYAIKQHTPSCRWIQEINKKSRHTENLSGSETDKSIEKKNDETPIEDSNKST